MIDSSDVFFLNCIVHVEFTKMSFTELNELQK